MQTHEQIRPQFIQS